MTNLDLWLFQLINGLAGHTPALDQAMQALVSDYVGPTLQVLGLLGVWFEGHTADERREHQRAVLRAAVVLLISSAVVVLINMLWARDRPFRYHDVNLLFYRPPDPSFPSNSATVVFGFATTVWLQNRRWGWPMLVLAASFAFSRVYCGVHYPADILAGFGLGAGTAWLVTRRLRQLDRLFDLVIALAQKLYLA